MIGFVLDHPRGEIVRVQLDRFAGSIVGAHHDLARARHAPPHVGDAETPFPLFDDILADGRDVGVDQDNGFDGLAEGSPD